MMFNKILLTSGKDLMVMLENAAVIRLDGGFFALFHSIFVADFFCQFFHRHFFLLVFGYQLPFPTTRQATENTIEQTNRKKMRNREKIQWKKDTEILIFGLKSESECFLYCD